MFGIARQLSFVASGVLCLQMLSLVLPLNAQEFRFASADWLCEIEGRTSEEATMKAIIEGGIDSSQVYISGIYTNCQTLDEIYAGIFDNYLPVITLQVAKTDGRILPFSTMNFENLSQKIEEFIGLYDWNAAAKREADAFLDLLKNRNSLLEFNTSTMAPAIVDVSDRTVSVAQRAEVQIGDRAASMTAIATSTLVDGYLVTATITDEISNSRDFWRAQLQAELLARDIGIHWGNDGQHKVRDQSSWGTESHGDAIIASSYSENSIYGNHKGILSTLCSEGKMFLYFTFPQESGFTGNNIDFETIYSIDGELNNDTWTSSDRRHIGTWSGHNAIPIIKMMSQAEEFKITFRRSGRSADHERTHTFRLDGFRDAVDPVRQRCNWRW